MRMRALLEYLKDVLQQGHVPIVWYSELPLMTHRIGQNFWLGMLVGRGSHLGLHMMHELKLTVQLVHAILLVLLGRLLYFEV